MNGGHIVNGSIAMAHIAAGAVGATELALSSVNSSHVVDGSLTIADLADRPTAAFNTPGIQLFVTVDAGPVQVIRSIPLTVPAAGKVIVSASGQFYFPDPMATDQVAFASTGTSLW